MDVLAAEERLAQLRLAGDVGENSELDLRVVGGQQALARLGDERGADLAAELGPDRDRLQVRVRGRQAPGRGDVLVDRRVQPPVLADQRRQRAEIGVQKLRQLAPLLDHRDDLVVGADRAQDLAVGRVAGLPLAAGSQLELLEEDPAELQRRADHELLARELVGARLELLDAIGEPRGDLAHAVRVDPDARVLHRREHAGERKLDLVVEPLEAALPHLLAQQRSEPARRLRVTDERRRLLLGRRLRLELEAVLGSEVVEQVLRAAGVDQVRRDHRVVGSFDPQRLRVVHRERDPVAL